MLTTRRSVVRVLGALSLSLVVAAPAALAQKKPLDHSVYDGWRRIAQQAISDDGLWALYQLRPGDGDGELRVHNLRTGEEIVVERGSGGAFTEDAAYVVARVEPARKDVREAKKAKKKPDEMPKAGLAIVNLATGAIERVERVKRFAVPEEGSDWVAYLLEKPLPEKKKQDAKGPAEEQAGRAKAKPSEHSAESAEKGDAKANKKKNKKQEGTTLVLRRLSSGVETRYPHVVEFAFNEKGDRLAFAAATKDGKGDGVFVVELGEKGAAEPLAAQRGEGTYKSLVFDEAGEQLAWLTDRDDVEAEAPAFALYRWRAGWRGARLVAGLGVEGVPAGWAVSEHRAPAFSKSGRHLLFGAAPRPQPEPEDDLLEEEKVKVDIWAWTDDRLQPEQLVQLEQDRKRSYLAIAHLYHAEDDIVVQLATEDVPNVVVADEGDGEIALGWSNLPYRTMRSWDIQAYSDLYLIEPSTGQRRKVVEKVRAGGFGAPAGLSPKGKYVYWWDLEQSAWKALNTRTEKIVELSKGLGQLWNRLHDTPSYPPPYGLGGWLEDDEGALLYDEFDVWLVDPAGRFPPRCVTEGFGRKHHLRLRVVDLDPDEPAVDPRAPLLLSAFDVRTRDAGFFRDRVRGDQLPEKLLMAPKRFSTPIKADDADRLLYSREDFREFPDLWVAGLDFSGARKISHANPQQAEYLWGTVELVEWTSGDGERLQGLLYKPDNFDPSAKYPMMVYFYERNSDNLHRHWAPAPSRSIINITFYVSRGYVVFVPDIPYKIGFPGESAYSAVVPGVTHILDMGFVDPARIGVEGHSWGGYQTAYLVTRTNIFAAAEAGAPVSNMTSAYGGIRWASGLSRMFQYEHTQSRIGGTLWNALHRYIENSPLFFADKVQTPLLMMHNDEDGAVPWYQGIEFFVALRRLGKPVWMLNYNGEAHGLRQWKNQKDWAIRMQQFFDHYLKGAPAPVWMVRGVPAVEKGRTLGLELVEEGRAKRAEDR